MSRIDEMIARLCPDGVEYRKLKELCRIEKGKTPIQKAIPGDYPLVVTAEERSSSVEYQLDGEAVCIPLVSSAGHGRATLKAVHYQSGKFALGNILAAVLPNDSEVLSAKFLYHYLMAKKDILLVPLMRGGANVSIPVERIGHVRIPAPPLDIQREIVNVLDVFAKLGVELEAELEARKVQYAHYRDELLFRESLEEMAGGEVDLRPLSDVLDMKAGVHIAASQISCEQTAETPYPCYGGNGLRGFVANPNQNGDKVLIGRQGALCGNVCAVSGEFYATEHAVVSTCSAELLPRYAFHMLVNADLNQYKSQGAQPGLAVGNLKQIELPIPSLSVQQQVVDILDRFDALTTSLTDGLPAEIEARRQQYEHYRDRLLDFPRKEVA